MKTSLIIPCTPNHYINNLFRVLKSYENNTVKPDEVIVSVSQYYNIDNNLLDKEYSRYLDKCLDNKIFKKFIILKHKEVKKHGPNRQAGSESASNDILIYGDADDVALPQRIEIIKYFFENYDICHLNHQWIGDISKSKELEIKKIKFIPSEKIYSYYFINNDLFECQNVCRAYGEHLLSYTAAGHLSIKKENLEKVKWRDWNELLFNIAEDYDFNMENCYYFNKSILINAPLIEYSNSGWLDGGFGEYYDIL